MKVFAVPYCFVLVLFILFFFLNFWVMHLYGITAASVVAMTFLFT